MGLSFETVDETALETSEETALDIWDTAEDVSLDTSDEISSDELSFSFGAEQPQRQATRHRHSAAENIFFNILSPLCSFNTRKSIFY
jgi:hypothetical protein